MRIRNHSSALCVLLLVGLMASPTPACLPDCTDPVAGFSSWPSTEWAGFYIIAIDTNTTLNAQWLSYDYETWLSHTWTRVEDGVMDFNDPPDYREIYWPTVGVKTVKLQVTDHDADICNEHGCCENHSAEAENKFLVVKAEKLQYWDNENLCFKDVTGTLYVPRFMTVGFKTIASGNVPVWPYGEPQWSGSSGASGTGDTKYVTFNTISSSTTDYKTVTVNCGSSSITANIIVFNYYGWTDPCDNFPGGSATKYGVCERVDLKLDQIVPAGLTPNQVGGLRWSIYSAPGAGTLQDVTDEGTALYIAPEQAFENVTLRLEVFSDVGAHHFKDYERDIIEPNGGYCPKMPGTNIWHKTWNTFSIGLRTNPYLRPTNVSFKWLEFQEGYCPSQVSGWFIHEFSGTWHDAWTFWAGVGGGDSTTGCPILISQDDAFLWDDTPRLPYYYGTFRWNIPWKYRANGSYIKTFITGGMNQEFMVHEDGKAEVQKDASGWYYNYHHWGPQSY